MSIECRNGLPLLMNGSIAESEQSVLQNLSFITASERRAVMLAAGLATGRLTGAIAHQTSRVISGPLTVTTIEHHASQAGTSNRARTLLAPTDACFLR